MLVQIRRSKNGSHENRLVHNEDYDVSIREKVAELLKFAEEKGWEIYDLSVLCTRGECLDKEFLSINMSTLFNKNIAKFDGEEVSE